VKGKRKKGRKATGGKKKGVLEVAIGRTQSDAGEHYLSHWDRGDSGRRPSKPAGTKPKTRYEGKKELIKKKKRNLVWIPNTKGGEARVEPTWFSEKDNHPHASIISQKDWQSVKKQPIKEEQTQKGRKGRSDLQPGRNDPGANAKERTGAHPGRVRERL